MLRWVKPDEDISPDRLDRGLRALVAEGAFSQVTLVLSTGAFLIGLALALGASNTVIGILSAVGPIAQVIQIPAIYLVERLRWRRFLSVSAAWLSRLALLGMATLPFPPWPESWRIPMLLAFLGLHYGLGAVSGCAFNSWIRDLVPMERLSSFFARRLTVATLVGALVSFGGGAAVDAMNDQFQLGAGSYAALFVVAGVVGLIGLTVLSRVPEPRMPQAPPEPIRALLMQPIRDTHFRAVLVFMAWWSFAVNFVAPFFAVYLLRELGLSMTFVLALSVLSQITNVAFFGLWGRLADRFTNKSVLLLAVPMFFLSLLLWPFTMMPEPHLLTFPLLIVIHVVSGIALAGVALCAGNLALKSAPYGRAASYLAVNALVSGVAAAIAPIIAGITADRLAPFELRLDLVFARWVEAAPVLQLPTIDIRGMDFLFVFAFIFGLYCMHRLLAVREEGEVTEKVLREAFFEETRRMVRQVSTVAGVRQVLIFPAGEFGTHPSREDVTRM